MSKRAQQARLIRDRAKRAMYALERDVAAGVVSKAYAARREQSLQEVIRQNTYDRASKSFGASGATAARRARKVFEEYSASSSQKMRALSVDDRRRQITPSKEKSFRADLEAALRGELSLAKMEEAEAFIKSTANLWEGYAAEDRLDIIAEKLGYLKGSDDSLIRAFRRWKRYTRDGEDFHEASAEDNYNRERVTEIWKKFRRTNDATRLEEELAKEFDS